MRSGSNRDARREADVVVVGAGLAGLMAARVLLAAGLQPLVVEARERLGGRVLNASIGGDAVVEMGGQWVGYRDQRMKALLEELGMETFATFDHGRNLIETGDRIRRYRGSIPRLSPRALLDLGRARWRLDRAARRVPAHAPWQAPDARAYDNTTFASWLTENVSTAEARSLLDLAIATIWGEDPHGVSLLNTLAFVSMAGKFDALSGTRGGLLQDRIVGGSGRLVELLAAQLGERVLCGSPVEAIIDRGTNVEVRAGNTLLTAARAIVTVPPVLAANIHFDPELPPNRAKALKSLPAGSVIKVAAIYPHPFWREHGLSGRAITMHGPLTSTFDNSPPSGEPGVLIGFAPGQRARELAGIGQAERRELVLETFARLYGPQAAKPEQYIEQDWTAERWTHGCYFGLPALGAITTLLPTIAEPTGNIHWAGAETALESYGGMDGALASGERAAKEIEL
jgi:monoamine oxidase